jgi:hypothetical protein
VETLLFFVNFTVQRLLIFGEQTRIATWQPASFRGWRPEFSWRRRF